MNKEAHMKWVAFGNCLLLVATVNLWIWAGVVPYEWVRVAKEMEETSVDVTVGDDDDLQSTIDILLDVDNPDFDFVWVPKPRFWIPFVLSYVEPSPSKLFLSGLEELWIRSLSSLLLVDHERKRLLSLVEDVSFDLDQPVVHYWIGVLNLGWVLDYAQLASSGGLTCSR